MNRKAAAILNLGVPELIVIALVALLVFGRKLPEAARSAGKTFGEFRKSVNKMQTEMRRASMDVEKDLKSAVGDVGENVPDEKTRLPLPPEPENPYARANETPEGGPKSGQVQSSESKPADSTGGKTPEKKIPDSINS